MTADGRAPDPALEAVVEVHDRFGPDVLDGIRLYNRLLEHPRGTDEVEGTWPRWFTTNPCGPGLFSIARAGDRVVGFSSLIAGEMRIAGRTVRSGKAEFLSVEPEFRRGRDVGSGARLPNALLSGLIRRAHEFGIEAVYSVPVKAALLVHIQAGARPMDQDAVEHVTWFRRPPTPPAASARDHARSLGLYALTRSRRMIAPRIRSGGAGIGPFDGFASVLPAPDQASNLLVNESPRMLDHRFASDRHWRYAIRRDGRPPAAFVFSRYPDDVRLSWWSTLDVDPDDAAALLRTVARRAADDGAAALRVKLPTAAVPAGWSFARWGFVGRPSSYSVFVYTADPELAAARLAVPWRTTNAHVGDF